MLAFFVFVSRYYVTCRNRQFEQSRWMIVVALLLFVVHYMCQMRLGWRQQGNDVGVLFNLLFYSPSAILLSWSQLNILRAGHRRWSFMRYGVVGYALMVLSPHFFSSSSCMVIIRSSNKSRLPFSFSMYCARIFRIMEYRARFSIRSNL